MTNLSLWKVSELQKITGGKLISNIKIIEQDIFITGVSTDSRDISEGDMFVAIDGERDGHDYVVDAFLSGAILALVSKIPAGYKNEAVFQWNRALIYEPDDELKEKIKFKLKKGL